MNKFNISLILLLNCLYLLTAPVELACPSKQIHLFQGEKVILDINIKNNLNQNIRPSEGYKLSYHIFDMTGRLLSFNNRRFSIPRVIKKRKTSSFRIPVYFNYQPSGSYLIEFDIVKEGHFWGASKKWQTFKFKLILKSLFSSDFKDKFLPTYMASSDPLLNKEQYILRVVLKNCELYRNGEIFGISASANHSQIWIRDLATFISYAKLFYPLSLLKKSVELFLENQKENGEILDWFTTFGDNDKNSVETDQESSLIMAAYEIAIEHPQWLNKIINGKSVINRLEMALDWVWDNKRNQEYGLVTSGFTADFGDVENTYPDQRATKLSAKSTPVLSIYTQAKYIQAIQKITEIFGFLDITEKTKKWSGRCQKIISLTKKHLFLKKQGYFIIHLVPSKQEYFEMEKNILAVGGNSEAILAGLMDTNQIIKFLNVIERRRVKYKLRTVGFTLIPPYPENFFPHHLLRKPWHYQNGGEWDWIGARLIKALFLNGFRAEAKQYLQEIIKKNLHNFTIFEWEDRQGTGYGSFYAGAAGIIGETILQGYLGYKEDFYNYYLKDNLKQYSLKIVENDIFSITKEKHIKINIRKIIDKKICYILNRESRQCISKIGETSITLLPDK